MAEAYRIGLVRQSVAVWILNLKLITHALADIRHE